MCQPQVLLRALAHCFGMKQGNGYEENEGEGCLGLVLFAVEKRSSKVLRQGIGGVENELTLSSVS